MLARPQQGFSLIELMVSITIGLLVLSGVIAVFSNTVSGSADNLGATRLNHDLRAYMDLMVRDIRRAGYAGAQPGVDNNDDGNVNSSDLTFNPFTGNAVDSSGKKTEHNNVNTSNASGEAADSCILFSYNLDADAEGPTTGPRVGCGTGCTPANAYEDSDNMEQFGYQLSNGALRTRTGGNSPPSCTAGTWQTLTDPSIEITNLNFAVTGTMYEHERDDGKPYTPNCLTCDCPNTTRPCQYMRVVTITLEGELRNDASVRQKIVQEVRLRNDRYVP